MPHHHPRLFLLLPRCRRNFRATPTENPYLTHVIGYRRAWPSVKDVLQQKLGRSFEENEHHEVVMLEGWRFCLVPMSYDTESVRDTTRKLRQAIRQL